MLENIFFPHRRKMQSSSAVSSPSLSAHGISSPTLQPIPKDLIHSWHTQWVSRTDAVYYLE